MAVVPIRLSKDQVRRINLLIKLGIYSNRSEAIKSMLERNMDLEVQRHLANPRVERLVQALLAYRRGSLQLTTKKTAVELIAEGRR